MKGKEWKPLQIRIGNGLLLVNLLVIILVVIVYLFPLNVLRIVLGLPFVLLFPGYALMGVLHPRKNEMGNVERAALSFGLSLASVILIGLILNYTPWGIRLESFIYSIALFIVILSIVAWLRQRQLVSTERFDITLTLTLPTWGNSIRDRILSVILILAALGALGMIGYNIIKPKVGQKFTEFYILGQDGTVATYPLNLAVGGEGKILVGIVNNEYSTVTYLVEVTINGVENTKVGGITLENMGKWENEITFTPDIAGNNQDVEFILYKDGKVDPTQEPLRLWINVTQ